MFLHFLRAETERGLSRKHIIEGKTNSRTTHSTVARVTLINSERERGVLSKLYLPLVEGAQKGAVVAQTFKAMGY